MTQAARLTSIDAVREMSAAMTVFRTEMVAALDEIDMEIRRALEWIHHERKQYWDGEARRGMERVTEARIQLQQAMTSKRVADHEPSCYDEKKAVDRAKRRADLAEKKKAVVRHWQHAIDHAVNEYRGGRTQLSSWLDAEVPRGLATLERLSQSLESYVSLAVPAGVARPMKLPTVEAEAPVETDSPPAEIPPEVTPSPGDTDSPLPSRESGRG
jgi:exonuclease VII large subunit